MNADMQITELNHTAIHVADLDRSIAFYRDVLGLPLIDRPDFKFPGAWFGMGDGQELHLIVSDRDDLSVPAERHTAYAVDDIDGAAAHLRGLGVEFRGPNPRPDGVPQIFLRDPDGHVVELCMPHA